MNIKNVTTINGKQISVWGPFKDSKQMNLFDKIPAPRHGIYFYVQGKQKPYQEFWVDESTRDYEIGSYITKFPNLKDTLQ